MIASTSTSTAVEYCLSSSLLLLVSLVVTVQYDQELYSVEEEDGHVTLALVLDKAVPFPVTVIVRTLDLLNSSVGDAATGELEHIGEILKVACGGMFCDFFYEFLQLPQQIILE